MASIRANHLSDGRRVYQVRWRDPDTRKETSYTCDTQGQADNFKRLLEANGNSLNHTLALLDAIRRDVPTVKQVLAEHIDGLPSITARTRADYRRDAAAHISPHIGWIPVDQLSEGQIKDWLKTLAATTMSDKTIANVHGVLSAAIASAIPKHRATNPCRGIRLPRRTEHTAPEMVFLTREEWQLLDREIGRIYAGWYQLLFRTLYVTGMRWGEAVALQVGDLSFTTKPPTIRISRASRRDEESRAYIGPTKTKKSRRTIGIPPQLAELLAAQVKGRPRNALVFTSRTGAPVHHSNVRTRIWLPATKAAMDTAVYGAAAIPVRPRVHDLRHTHASQQIAEGLDLLAVQRRLGHESLKTTADRYGHLMPAQQEASAAAAGRAMEW